MAFDLEQFPTSESAQRMMSRVSPIYEDSYVGKWLFEVMGLEWDEARELVDSLRAQCFFEQCTWALPYWEQMYGITPDDSKTDEKRKTAVRVKMTRGGSVTPASLEDVLEAMTGRTVDVTEDNPHYQFTITIGEGSEAIDYTVIIEKVNKTKPSHLAYSINLLRKGTLTVYIGVGLYAVKTITLTEMDETGIDDVNILVDEDGEYLMDEDGNILVDNE
ncbi:MAG: YmfQ family protein [Lachnospiraceae bacterium]|nr:YmfQ family protein [Lachnospiraceae bacterium]